jgi:hypothetical protein
MHVVHVDPEEAVQIYQDLVAPHPGKPLPLMLAIHWGTFRLTDEAVGEPPERLRAFWREHALAEERLWILDVGEARSLQRAQ